MYLNYTSINIHMRNMVLVHSSVMQDLIRFPALIFSTGHLREDEYESRVYLLIR